MREREREGQCPKDKPVKERAKRSFVLTSKREHHG
jgi:hypothetical protein